VYRVYLPAGGDFSRVRLPTLTIEKGSTTDKLASCTLHTNPVPVPERAPATTTPSTAGVSAGATPPPGEFYKPAQKKYSGLLANADAAYAEAYVVRPPAPDVIVITGKAPTHAPGDRPSDLHGHADGH
jgi:hypothetical protein